MSVFNALARSMQRLGTIPVPAATEMNKILTERKHHVQWASAIVGKQRMSSVIMMIKKMLDQDERLMQVNDEYFVDRPGASPMRQLSSSDRSHRPHHRAVVSERA